MWDVGFKITLASIDIIRKKPAVPDSILIYIHCRYYDRTGRYADRLIGHTYIHLASVKDMTNEQIVDTVCRKIREKVKAGDTTFIANGWTRADLCPAKIRRHAVQEACSEATAPGYVFGRIPERYE